MAVYTGVGDRPSIPKVMTSGEILQDGKKPGNFIAVYVHQNGEKFQNSILSQEGNLRQRTYLNILLLIFS